MARHSVVATDFDTQRFELRRPVQTFRLLLPTFFTMGALFNRCPNERKVYARVTAVATKNARPTNTPHIETERCLLE